MFTDRFIKVPVRMENRALAEMGISISDERENEMSIDPNKIYAYLSNTCPNTGEPITEVRFVNDDVILVYWPVERFEEQMNQLR